MDCQMIDGEKSIKHGKSFGLDSDDYQAFLSSYNELSYAMAHNDYSFVSLFDTMRDSIGKKNFNKFLTETLRFTSSEVSDLNRKLSAYQMIPSQTVWNTIGYRGIQKIMSLPNDIRENLLRDISEQGENLTPKQFFALYSKYAKSWSPRDKSTRSEQSGRSKQDRINLTRSDLERIVRHSIEGVMNIKTRNKGKRNKSRGQFACQPMMV